jgi:hypothetical protein
MLRQVTLSEGGPPCLVMISSVTSAALSLPFSCPSQSMRKQNSDAPNAKAPESRSRSPLFRLKPLKRARFPMKCPHCEKEIPGKHCSSCGSLIPAESRFCMECGARLADEGVTSAQGEEAFDDDRILCPDGTCTGIIVDGKCTECGKPFPATPSTES